MMELSMEERSFILEYRQASPQGQELARQKLREAAVKEEQERIMGKKRGTGT